MKRGALIIFEGCDRSGKTTQCKKLVKRLTAEGKKVSFMHFPDRTTTIGQMIDKYLKQSVELDDWAIHLLFSANRWEARKAMTQQLLNGTTLIIDRYAYSGVAFTAAKGLNVNVCKQPDVGLLKPDKVIFMQVNSQSAASRSEFGQERYEKLDFQQKVDQIFNELKDPSYWQTVIGDNSIEEVHSEVYKIATDVIKNAEAAPLKQLWVEEDDSSSAEDTQ